LSVHHGKTLSITIIVVSVSLCVHSSVCECGCVCGKNFGKKCRRRICQCEGRKLKKSFATVHSERREVHRGNRKEGPLEHIDTVIDTGDIGTVCVSRAVGFSLLEPELKRKGRRRRRRRSIIGSG